MKFKRGLAIVFLLLAVLTFLFSMPSITGLVIFDSEFNGTINILGLIFLIIGLILFGHSQAHGATLEKRVSVYRESHKKGGDEDSHYFMTDPELSFGLSGVVSLYEFRKEIDSYRAMGKEGEDLINVIRQEYEPPLLEIVASHDEDKSSIAEDFLKVLSPEEESLGERSSYKKLSREERREIQLAFRNWEGSLDKKQREVVNKYGLTGEVSGRHMKIRQKGYDDNPVTASLTPGDYRAGRNLSGHIIKMLEQNMNKNGN